MKNLKLVACEKLADINYLSCTKFLGFSGQERLCVTVSDPQVHNLYISSSEESLLMVTVVDPSVATVLLSSTSECFFLFREQLR